MAQIERKPVYVITTSSTDILYAGQRWIVFTNLGASNVTITCKSNDGITTYSQFVIGAGLSLNLGVREDGNEWARFDINAGSSTLQAVFEKANNPNT